MASPLVITGLGMVTPLGSDPEEVFRRIAANERAVATPSAFDAAPFACPVCAQVRDFEPQRFVPEVKMLRLMNRDAQFAVAAAHLALEDARLVVGRDYAPEDIALFGATGLAGLPLGDVAPLLRASVTAEGRLDPVGFGHSGLRAISPLLSFKILGNMPLCFVSIGENIQGPNAIYTPWEGHGVQAIDAGCRAIRDGHARCALVGGCDVKTHELAFITLEQLGAFDSWRGEGAGLVPGEGAVFLVLETEAEARRRHTRIYARLMRSAGPSGEAPFDGDLAGVVAAANGIPAWEQAEIVALAAVGVAPPAWLCPKKCAGDLFAAAAPLQLAVAAGLAARAAGPVLARCSGFRTEPTAFVLAHAGEKIE